MKITLTSQISLGMLVRISDCLLYLGHKDASDNYRPLHDLLGTRNHQQSPGLLRRPRQVTHGSPEAHSSGILCVVVHKQLCKPDRLRLHVKEFQESVHHGAGIFVSWSEKAEKDAVLGPNDGQVLCGDPLQCVRPWFETDCVPNSSPEGGTTSGGNLRQRGQFFVEIELTCKPRINIIHVL